ncbi:YoaK family protein [Komagataeibacter kakiaceti JCM 25156]|uniref:YoaK family protein n=1 Tax=Komagataeibacter kakiaceti TaxID=943261 RepID=UPI000470A88D|nr:YoaK family protein [Komagataeibacter kakiaceti]
MLVHEGTSRNIGTDLRLGCTLAAMAGAINVTGFLSVGYYCANMTGNLSALATSLTADGKLALVSCLGLIGAFIGGGVAATLLVNAGHRRGVHAVYACGIVLEGALLAGLGMLAELLPLEQTAWMLAYGLSFLMGLQNATVTHISGARVRTTHMTGMLTDFGIELAQWLEHRHAGETLTRVRERLRLHGAIILSFGLGGIGGVALYMRCGVMGLTLMGVTLIVLALPTVVRTMRQT